MQRDLPVKTLEELRPPLVDDAEAPSERGRPQGWRGENERRADRRYLNVMSEETPRSGRPILQIG